MNKLRVGIIGCGTISKVHFEAIEQVAEIELVGVASKNRDDAISAAEKLKCIAFSTSYELIEDPGIELVVLLTPPGAHKDLILHAIKNKKHLLVEKPIGTDLDAIDTYIKQANEEGLVLSCISQHRFDPASVFVKEKLDNNELGKVTGANCIVNWHRDQSYYNYWRSSYDMAGGGVLAIQAIHTIDLMLWYMGEVESVRAYTSRSCHENIDVEDIAMAAIRFKNGTLGMISATTCAYPGYPARLDIFGCSGSVTIEGDEISFFQTKHMNGNQFSNVKQGEAVSDPAGVSSEAISKQYKDVHKAIHNKTKPLISGEEARRTYALIDAIYRSARSSNEVLV